MSSNANNNSEVSDSQAGAGGWVRCSQAFLLSMVNPGGLGPTNMPLFKSDEYAIDYDAMLLFTT